VTGQEAGGDAVIETRGLAKAFGDREALRGVSFAAHRGELLAVIGPNGAGKTSIFNCLNQVYHPKEGDIRWKGQSIMGLRPDQVAARGIARTFQNIELFEHATVLENLLIGRHCRSRPNILAELLFTPGVKAPTPQTVVPGGPGDN